MPKLTLEMILGGVALIAFCVWEFVSLSSSIVKVDVLPVPLPRQNEEPLILPVKVRNAGWFSIEREIVWCAVQPIGDDEIITTEHSHIAGSYENDPTIMIPSKAEATSNCLIQGHELGAESNPKKAVLLVHVGFKPSLAFRGQIETYRFIGTIVEQTWQWSLRPLMVRSR